MAGAVIRHPRRVSQHLRNGVDGGKRANIREDKTQTSPWGQGWRKSWPHMCYTLLGHLRPGMDGGSARKETLYNLKAPP